MKYDDICDLVLAKEVRKKDSDELLGSGFALNVDYWGRDNNRDYKGSNKGRFYIRDKVCVEIVKSLSTSRRLVEIQRQKRIICKRCNRRC